MTSFFAKSNPELRAPLTLDLLPVGVYTCDAPSGLITSYNQQAERLWGRAPRLGDTDERFCGSLRLFLPDGTPLPHERTPMAMALREGRSFRNQDVVIERPDGSRVSVLVNIDPIRDRNGRVVGAVNAFHDTTALRATLDGMRRSEERLRAVVEATPACIDLVARDGTVLDMNAPGIAMLEASRLEQVVGRSFYDFVAPEDVETVRAFHERVVSGERSRLEFDVIGFAGTRRSLETHAVPLREADGHVLKLAVSHDVTERKRAGEVKSRLAAIVESSDDAIISHDMHGVVTSFNGAAERLYGYTAAEIVGRPLSLLIPADKTDRFPANMEQLRRGERIEHYETVRVAKDGRRIDVSLTISPVRDSTGRIVGASKIARDIGERKRAEAALRKHGERTRLLWEAAGVLLTTNDPHEMLQALFAKICSSLGLDFYFNYVLTEEGDALRLVSCAGVDERFMETCRRLDFGQAVCGTVALRKVPIVATDIQDSDEPMVQLVKREGVRAYACSPLMAGDRLLGTLSFASRKRDRFEPDEIEFLQTISHYVTAAYERLRLIEELRHQDRRKDEFLATLAHELRNPLAPIRTAMELVRRAEGRPELLERAHAIMNRQLSHMVHLVDDLLDVSRISRNKLELRKAPVELAAVVANAVETSRPLVDAAGQRLEVSLPVEDLLLDADPLRLAQAFSNLLNNASKYTEKGGRIWLTATRASDDPSQVLVSVRDTGIGIPSDKLRHIFEMFAQVDDSLERAQGGLGIGLTLTRRLVELHGGTITATSAGPGQGSEFTVRLPLTPREAIRAEEPRPAPKQHRTSAPRRILIADDNRDSAEMLAAMLEYLGHEVTQAHDGLEAAERLLALKPHIAFLDVGMPKLNGYEVAKSVREQPWGREMTLVAVTGWGQDDDRLRSKQAGFDVHLVKPVDVAAIEQLLGQLATN